MPPGSASPAPLPAIAASAENGSNAARPAGAAAGAAAAGLSDWDAASAGAADVVSRVMGSSTGLHHTSVAMGISPARSRFDRPQASGISRVFAYAAPMPVSLASTLDGTYVAVLRGGTVTLHASDGAGEVAQASTGLDLDGTIAFAARHVLVHVVDGRRSVLSALSVPKLAIVSQLELDAPTRLLAVTHGYALLDRGDAAFVAQCTTGAL